MKKLLLYVVLFVGLTSFKGCFSYEDVDFNGVSSFNVPDKSLDHLVFDVGLDIENPNPYNLKIKPSELDIYINDKHAGKAKITDKITIKKKTRAVYIAKIKTNGKEVMKALGSSIKGLFTGSMKITLKGQVRGGAYGVTKKFDVNFSETVNPRELMGF